MSASFVNKLFPNLVAKQHPPESLFSKKRGLAFILALLQLAAALLIVKNFNIEKSSGISDIAPIILLAFIINSLVPLKYRQMVLFATCISVIYFAFGFVAGSLFILSALMVIGICHLPIAFWIRVLLLLLAFAVIFLFRIKAISFLPGYSISAFLASMFMFRLLIYLYELRHGMVPFSFWQSVSYFFLFPNICFLFFPIVDYKTFAKTYYSLPDEELWQKGIRWILRGITHIIAYRIVYYYFLIGPSEITGTLSLLRYITANYALILRLSGLFHFIVGLLCLFGLNLPQVFNNYFLATSFVDLWRRINIYWREFMLKLFFYPIMFKLKKRMEKNLLATTMLFVFVISWFFHGYQLFWVQGNYHFNILDLAFWLILGGCITLNAVILEKRSREVAKPRSTRVSYLITMLRMSGMLLFMSVMWSLWDSDTFSEWVYIMSNFRNCPPRVALGIAAGFIGFISLGYIAQVLLNKKVIQELFSIKPQHTLFLTLPVLGLMLLCSFNITKKVLPGQVYTFIKTIADEKLNREDYNKAEDSYYKKLIDGEDGTVAGLWNLNFKSVKRNSANSEVFVKAGDILGKMYKPNLDVFVNDKSFKTDSFGLRDKDYPLLKLPGTYRMALLGGSYEMGSGVNDEDVFEVLVEDRLNATATDSVFARYEIMNFAAGGFHALQHVELCHNRVFRYKPDAVIYVAHSEETTRFVNSLAKLIYKKKNLKYPLPEFVKRLVTKPGMSESEIRKRLEPYGKVLLKWAYTEISTLCRRHHALAVWVFLPTTTDSGDPAELAFTRALAAENHFVQLDLSGAYKNYGRKDIIISEWNTHPNAFGHKLIADKFYEELIKHKKTIFESKR